MGANEQRRGEFERALTAEVYGAAWRYACRLCTAAGVVSRDEAEDLLQESLARAYLRLSQLRDSSRFKGWLLSIVRTQHLNRLRRAACRFTAELPPVLADKLPAPDPLADKLREALCRLPVAQRELLDLFYIEELTLEETGQVLGISPHIVGKRLFRAREALRRQVRQFGSAQPYTATQPNSSKGVTP